MQAVFASMRSSDSGQRSSFRLRLVRVRERFVRADQSIRRDRLPKGPRL